MHEVTARIEIPTRTILKVLLVLAVLWFLARIGPVLSQIFAGILLAMTLYPPVARLQRRGFSKGRAIATVFGLFVLGLGLMLWFLIPRWIDDGQKFWDDLPGYIEDGSGWLDDNAPWLVDRIVEWVEGEASEAEVAPASGEAPAGTEADVSTGTTEITEVTADVDAEDDVVDSAVSAGQEVAGFVGNAFVAIVLAIYFLVDGDRTFRWLARDLSPGVVRRVRRATLAMSAVVSEYVSKQVVTCVICGVYTYAVLEALGVPSPFILATIAALTDAIPLVGVVMATIPAMTVALTQGWEVAAAVLIAYVAYQAFENYILIPRIFGQTLKLSSFGMLMAVLIGWKLAGLVGVLLALPTAAALLVVERVWLEDEEDADLDETEAPGPVKTASALVAVAADALEEEPERGGEATDQPTADSLPGRDAASPEEAPSAAPAPGPRPAGAGRERRGGRRHRTGQAAPGTTQG